MRRLFAILSLLVVLIMPSMAVASGQHVAIRTSHGDIIIALNEEAAPKTVANFLEYVRSGHYDRTLIHRIVKGYVIQGGGYSRYYRERRVREPVEYEGDNGLKNVRGTIAMARGISHQSAQAQWYINLRDNEKLDHLVNDLGTRYGYTVFGTVVEGLDVADAIGALETGDVGPFRQEAPLEPVVINRVDVIEYP